jgi:hypothetical protein
MIKQMDMEYSLIQIMQDMKETGWMICSMVMVLNLGIMGLQNILGSFIKERKMGKAGLIGKMAAIMMVILLMDSSKVLENITSQI